MCNVKVLYILTKNNLQKKKQGATNVMTCLKKWKKGVCVCMCVVGWCLLIYTYKQEISERIYQKLITLVWLPVGRGRG